MNPDRRCCCAQEHSELKLGKPVSAVLVFDVKTYKILYAHTVNFFYVVAVNNPAAEFQKVSAKSFTTRSRDVWSSYFPNNTPLMAYCLFVWWVDDYKWREQFLWSARQYHFVDTTILLSTFFSCTPTSCRYRMLDFICFASTSDSFCDLLHAEYRKNTQEPPISCVYWKSFDRCYYE